MGYATQTECSTSDLASVFPKLLNSASFHRRHFDLVAFDPLQVHITCMILRSLLLSMSVMLGACAPTTPDARIEENPEKFWKLGDKDQQLIRNGQISRGMSPDAVYYAWGKPAREFAGADDKTSTLRWDYTGSTPVYSTGFAGYYGRGYGRHGRYYPRQGYGYSQQVTYVPYQKATVWFRNNRVTKWERAR